MTYPVLLRVAGREVAVIGGGRVAARKVRDLLDAGARVTVISPALDPALAAAHEAGAIVWRAEPYRRESLAEARPFIVLAATDSLSVNRVVLDDARALNLLAGAADANDGDFTGLASFQRGPVTVAVGTDGASPALAAYLRRELEGLVGPEYARLAHWLAALRPSVRQRLGEERARRMLWEAILESSAVADLRRGDEAAALGAVRRVLREYGLDGAV